ncbi:MAG: proliferating cell nuclear antigen (pcna) [Candidatus Korarchaeota archaeon]
MGFKIKFSEPSVLKEIIEATLVVVEETNIVVSPEGLFIKAIDGSRAAMIELMYPSDSFEEFDCSERVEIGISFTEAKKILPRIGVNEVVVLEYSEKTGKLLLKISGETEREYGLRIMDMGRSEIPSLNVSFPAKITLPAAVFSKYIKDVEIAGETIIFSVEKGVFQIRSESEVSHAVIKVNLSGSPISNFESSSSEKINAEFPTTWLRNLTKIATSAENVTIALGNRVPLKLEYTLEKGKLVYYLAPVS